MARDEGQVLFFCGAGVSRAKADLPGFLSLAEQVLETLRALPDSSARQLMNVAEKLQAEPIKGVGGILAADRIFGLLERDFDLADVERAVGQALRPRPDANLEAHKIMLALSRGPSGQTQLVTTNFDLLFEKAAPRVPVFTPNDLPDFDRRSQFEGVVHLHGMLDVNYTESLGGRLVLSSAEFGRAYLAEGWATDFIRAAIARYKIVFVGYTADDPPVQYLLEALNRVGNGENNGLYAFQEGGAGDAAALWSHKGVTAIPYSPDTDHVRLWDTLSAWAERARDSERWRRSLLRRAQRGPAAMQAHERGQIAHLAATLDGARALAESVRPLPAEWLCVFDPSVRFGTPRRMNLVDDGAPEVDPFLRYGLDSDPVPTKEREGNFAKRRDVPSDTLNILAPLKLDGTAHYLFGLRGDSRQMIAPIPERLVSLARWIARVSKEPAAIWWAAGQSGIHPVLRQNIERALSKSGTPTDTKTREIWRLILEAWQQVDGGDFEGLYRLGERIKKEGWTFSTRRALALHLRSTLKVDRPFGAGPPLKTRRWGRHDVVSITPSHPEAELPFSIPDQEIPFLLPLLRQNIVNAAALEMEIIPYDLHIPPIEEDPNLPGESSDRSFGLNPQILRFAKMFKSLVQNDRDKAQIEFEAWPQNDDPVFARLRVWAAGLPDFLGADDASRVLANISDRVFWGDRDQRDLLLALASRWSDMSLEMRKKIERRLRRGLPRRPYYDRKFFPKMRARSIVERLVWLSSQGCHFSFNVDAEIAEARAAIPEWNDVDGVTAADSIEGRGGTVHTDTSFESLVDTPSECLIEVALGAYRRRHGFLQVQDPYAGLVQEKPLRVIAALRLFQKPTDIAVLGWTRFLDSGARLNDEPRLAYLIARRLMLVRPTILSAISDVVVRWLARRAAPLFERDADVVWNLFDRLTGEIVDIQKASEQKISSDRSVRDWTSSAFSSLVGQLVEILMADPQLVGLAANAGFPAQWLMRAERLLHLLGDPGLYVLVEFSRRLNFLFFVDPVWTEREILSLLDGNELEREAVLAGFFSNAKISGEQLFNRLKPELFQLAVSESAVGNPQEITIANLLASAWRVRSKDGGRFFPNDELRTVIVKSSDAVRLHILWQAGRWSFEDKITLLRDVWPLQLASRTPLVSARLFQMPFEDEINFEALAGAIIPMLAPISDRESLLMFDGERRSRLIVRYPKIVLELLWKVLPARAQNWPFGTGDMLAELRKADPKLARSQKFAELRRRLAKSN